MVQRTSSMINIIGIVALGDDKNQFGTRDEDERGWCFWRGKIELFFVDERNVFGVHSECI